MPFGKCPVCGITCHLNVTDVATWYRERHPTVPPGSIVPIICFFCEQEINKGDRVIVRRIIGNEKHVQKDEKGTVSAVLNSEDGSVFVVTMDSGKEACLVRAEIRKPIETDG